MLSAISLTREHASRWVCEASHKKTREVKVNLKLYRTVDRVTEYWESWTEGTSAFIHSGRAGEKGEIQMFSMGDKQQANAMFKEVEKAENGGFKPRTFEEMAQIVIQYRLQSWGSVEDHNRRVKIEDLLSNCLKATCMGSCDGGEIGAGAMNVFCDVVDGPAAVPIIVKELGEHGELEGAVIAKRERTGDDDYRVVWPKDYPRAFSIF